VVDEVRAFEFALLAAGASSPAEPTTLAPTPSPSPTYLLVLFFFFFFFLAPSSAAVPSLYAQVNKCYVNPMHAHNLQVACMCASARGSDTPSVRTRKHF